MPSKIMNIDLSSVPQLLFAGGLGMFFEDLIQKVIITTLALLFATTVVFFYKKWLSKNYK